MKATSKQILEHVRKWREGKHATQVSVLSGDGGLGKTSLAEALMLEKCPQGFWFLDDPDDFRELQGLLSSGQGIVIDEISMSDYTPNQIKKLFDVKKTRRIKCRHFNGTKPNGCPMILSTNSPFESFFPKMQDKNDKTGVFRRTLFESIDSNIIRQLTQTSTTTTDTAKHEDNAWCVCLKEICRQAALTAGRTESLVRAADDLGIALTSEVQEHASVLASTVGLKALEQKRFLGAVMHMPIPPIPKHVEDGDMPHGSGRMLPCRDDEEDVFGFGPCA